MREYDLATVCKWIGNSPAVAAKHYAMSIDLDSDFKRAAGKNRRPPKAQQSAANSDVQDMTQVTDEKQKALEDQGFVNDCQSFATAAEREEWAIQGSNL